MDKPLIASRQLEPKDPSTWKRWQKNCFRFFLIFISVQTLVAYNSFYTVTHLPLYSTAQFLDLFDGQLAWMDRNIFHWGYNPDIQPSFFGDGVFGWLFLIYLFFISLIIAVFWGLVDRKRKNYNKLHYWFRVYLAYYLFIAIIMYASIKIIPTQMPYPDVNRLISPMGDLSGMSLAWTFLGARPAYSIFTGICEFIGILLILSRRTRVFGSLFLATVLINVVCLNIFYNIMVKLLSLHLLLVDLFLLAPYVPRLIRFFYYLEPISLSEKEYVFSSPWKKYIMALLLLAPAWVAYKSVAQALAWYKLDTMNLKNQKLYVVTDFIKYRDSSTNQLADTLVWKNFTLSNYRDHSFATIYRMQGQHDQFEYDIDSVQKIISLHFTTDKGFWHRFQYDNPQTDQLVLTGKWMDEPVKIVMKQLNTDSLRLNREKMTWIYRPVTP